MQQAEHFICENISVNEAGHLTFAGQDTTVLAKTYQTPLYLMDEDRLRYNCRVYTKAFEKHFGGNGCVLYASKAAAFKQIYRIVQEEGLGIDVVSFGEIYTAAQAGFDLSNAYFHSNYKTDEDIRLAMEYKVGYFVVDNEEELSVIGAEAERKGITQKVLLRITPGIDTHTYEAVRTGQVDSKFGVAIETGQADAFVKKALDIPSISLMGFHCHVGSQVFEEDVFERSACVMLAYMRTVKETFGYEAQILDLGGGYGVRYTENDGSIDIDEKIGSVAKTVKDCCESLGIPVPQILMEPGRSIVADTGMTLYTVGSLKQIPGYKNYVSVDGGMTDNPRYALYESAYTCYIANRMLEERSLKADLVGRCCESGDIVQPDICVPETVTRGDIAAVCTTGAYNYSMASNYNRLGRPALVMLKAGESYVAVKRESAEDLVLLDL